MMFVICNLIIVILLMVLLYHYYEEYKKHKYKVSFKESLSLTNLPIISIELIDGSTINMLLDTGSEGNVIDKSFVEAEVGKLTPNGTTVGTTGEAHSYGGLLMEFTINQNKFNEEFFISDLIIPIEHIKERGITISGILGSSFFDKNKYILDYKDKIFYNKN